MKVAISQYEPSDYSTPQTDPLRKALGSLEGEQGLRVLRDAAIPEIIRKKESGKKESLQELETLKRVPPPTAEEVLRLVTAFKEGLDSDTSNVVSHKKHFSDLKRTLGTKDEKVVCDWIFERLNELRETQTKQTLIDRKLGNPNSTLTEEEKSNLRSQKQQLVEKGSELQATYDQIMTNPEAFAQMISQSLSEAHSGLINQIEGTRLPGLGIEIAEQKSALQGFGQAISRIESFAGKSPQEFSLFEIKDATAQEVKDMLAGINVRLEVPNITDSEKALLNTIKNTLDTKLTDNVSGQLINASILVSKDEFKYLKGLHKEISPILQQQEEVARTQAFGLRQNVLGELRKEHDRLLTREPGAAAKIEIAHNTIQNIHSESPAGSIMTDMSQALSTLSSNLNDNQNVSQSFKSFLRNTLNSIKNFFGGKKESDLKAPGMKTAEALSDIVSFAKENKSAQPVVSAWDRHKSQGGSLRDLARNLGKPPEPSTPTAEKPKPK